MYRTIEFLMVEDNPGDIRLTREYLKDFSVSTCLNVVKDDSEALKFLRAQDEYALAIQPDIMLISIRELWKKGNRLLQQIEGDATLAHIPIVILTAFEGEEASLHDSLVGILCVSKPLDMSALDAIVSHIDNFGLTTVKPKGSPKHNMPVQSQYGFNHFSIYKSTQDRQEPLQKWENERGRIAYDSE